MVENDENAVSIEEIVAMTFNAQFALVDLREIYRQTKPVYSLDEGKKQQVKSIIETVRACVDLVESVFIEQERGLVK